MSFGRMVFVLLLCCGGGAAILADVRVASPFGDNMVLQRARPVPVWGTAAAGEAVTVTFGAQVVHTAADARGQWQLRLAPLTASSVPATLVVAGTNTLNFTNVLVGEVWVCSGQSNMEWALGSTEHAASAIAAADNAQIRLCTVAHAVALTPQTTCACAWVVCSPKSAPSFSAVGYYFARQLQATLHVPVGVINASWGGTRAEPWTSLPGLKTLPSFRQQATQFEHAVHSDAAQLTREHDAAVRDYADRRAAWYRQLDARDPGLQRHWMALRTDTSSWRALALPCPKAQNPLGYFVGSLWCRKDVTIPASWVGRPLTLQLGIIDETDDTYVNGVHVGRTWFETPEFWKVARRYPVPATAVTSTTVSVTVRVLNLYYDVGLYGPAESMTLAPQDAAAEPAVSLAGNWRYTDGLAIGHGEIPLLTPSTPPVNGSNTPTTLFNGMINPLIPFAMRGVIWYQGESNAASDAYGEYHELFSGLITSWRTAWGEGDFPFAFVQLANFMAPQQVSVEKGSWAELRQAQAETLALPNTTMAVTIDIGDANSIHPLRKQEVGARLASGVLAQTYYVATPLPSGPCFTALRAAGTRLRVRFRFADGLRCTGDAVTGFAVAGADKVFHAATARIDGDTVLVWSDQVAHPVAVRYGWANNPPCNLCNRAGLPAAPFRSDQWADFSVAP